MNIWRKIIPDDYVALKKIQEIVVNDRLSATSSDKGQCRPNNDVNVKEKHN